MKRCILIAAMLLLLTGCDSVRFDDALAIRFEHGKNVSIYDDHGGFHGDGARIETVFYPVDAFCAEISGRTEWNPLPLPGDADRLLRWISSLFPEDLIGTLFPVPQDGYWFFHDRHDKVIEPSDVSAAIERFSFNLTIAIYDLEAQMLYYLEIDT